MIPCMGGKRGAQRCVIEEARGVIIKVRVLVQKVIWTRGGKNECVPGCSREVK